MCVINRQNIILKCGMRGHFRYTYTCPKKVVLTIKDQVWRWLKTLKSKAKHTWTDAEPIAKKGLNGARLELEALVEINFFSFLLLFFLYFFSFCLTRIGTPQKFRSNGYKVWHMEILQQTLKNVQNFLSSARQFSEPNLKILNSPNLAKWGTDGCEIFFSCLKC